MSVSVCVFVCLSVRERISDLPVRSSSHAYAVMAVYCSLCTSGYMNNVLFEHNDKSQRKKVYTQSSSTGAAPDRRRSLVSTTSLL